MICDATPSHPHYLPFLRLRTPTVPIYSAPDLEAGDKVEKKVGTGGSDEIKEEDVGLVVAQTGCTPEKAREALEAEKGDLINASASSSHHVKTSLTPVMRVGA